MSRLITNGLGGGVGLLLTFGLGPGSSTPRAPNLMAAIIERAHGTPALNDMIPGGVIVGSGKDDMPIPFVTLFPVGGTENRNTGESFWVWEVIRADIFAAGYDEMWNIGIMWGETFRKEMQPLLIQDARYGQIVSSMPRYVGEDTEQGRALHHGYVEMTVITSRRRA